MISHKRFWFLLWPLKLIYTLCISLVSFQIYFIVKTAERFPFCLRFLLFSFLLILNLLCSLLQFDGFVDLDLYDSIAMKVRGDGRCYISTVSFFSSLEELGCKGKKIWFYIQWCKYLSFIIELKTLKYFKF